MNLTHDQIPQPTMDLQGRRDAERRIAELRRDARRDYVRYSEQEADAERDYRKQMSVEFAKCKGDGKTNQQAEIDAKAATAELRHRRDIAHSMAYATRMHIEELERQAVTVRDIHATSERIDGVTA